MVTRASARSIQSDLRTALMEGQGKVTLDFRGIQGLTPSFLDETLSIIEESMRLTADKHLEVTLINPPTELSSKFSAVSRGHGLVMSDTEAGTWVMSDAQEEPSSSEPHENTNV